MRGTRRAPRNVLQRNQARRLLLGTARRADGLALQIPMVESVVANTSICASLAASTAW